MLSIRPSEAVTRRIPDPIAAQMDRRAPRAHLETPVLGAHRRIRVPRRRHRSAAPCPTIAPGRSPGLAAHLRSRPGVATVVTRVRVTHHPHHPLRPIARCAPPRRFLLARPISVHATHSSIAGRRHDGRTIDRSPSAGARCRDGPRCTRARVRVSSRRVVVCDACATWQPAAAAARCCPGLLSAPSHHAIEDPLHVRLPGPSTVEMRHLRFVHSPRLIGSEFHPSGCRSVARR